MRTWPKKRMKVLLQQQLKLLLPLHKLMKYKNKLKKRLNRKDACPPRSKLELCARYSALREFRRSGAPAVLSGQIPRRT